MSLSETFIDNSPFTKCLQQEAVMGTCSPLKSCCFNSCVAVVSGSWRRFVECFRLQAAGPVSSAEGLHPASARRGLLSGSGSHCCRAADAYASWGDDSAVHDLILSSLTCYSLTHHGSFYIRYLPSDAFTSSHSLIGFFLGFIFLSSSLRMHFGFLFKSARNIFLDTTAKSWYVMGRGRKH